MRNCYVGALDLAGFTAACNSDSIDSFCDKCRFTKHYKKPNEHNSLKEQFFYFKELLHGSNSLFPSQQIFLKSQQTNLINQKTLKDKHLPIHF